MAYRMQRLRLILIVLLGVYLFIYPWSILLVALDCVPGWGTWMGGALLILQGTLMGLWLSANYGRYGLLATVLILIISWAIEHIGVTTGFPFGTYSYTDVLAPKVGGVVPLAIPFAWLMVVPAAIGITERVLHGRDIGQQYISSAHHATTFHMLLKALGAASFALLLDVTIEPVSVHVNGYWVWDDVRSGFYGVPVSNFAAWWVTSVILVWLLLWLQQVATKQWHNDRRATHPTTDMGRLEAYPTLAAKVVSQWLPPLLYMLNLTMFVLVNIAHAQVAPSIIGGLVLVYLAFNWLKPPTVRHGLCSIMDGVIMCYLAFIWLKPSIGRRMLSTERTDWQK